MGSVKIGFFDSGTGGISVAARARERFPSADYIYYADTDNVPYGEKTKDQIIEYSDKAIRCLIEWGVSVIVIACNTATSMAASYLRQKYTVPIIGMEPAVKPASEYHSGDKILVCATPVTIAGEKLRLLIENSFDENEPRPDLAALGELVRYAENNVFDTDIICSYLKSRIPEPEKYTAVVLGCTHFPYFRDSFRKFFGEHIDLIDGTEGTVNRLVEVLEGLGIEKKDETGSIEFLQSGREITDKNILAFYKTLEKKSLQ